MWSPTSPDALPLSYRKLVEAEATTLASSDKHPTYCEDWDDDRAIFVWPWKMVSVSVPYLFYQPMDEKIKTRTPRFPNRKIINKKYGEDIARLANSVAVWRQSEVSIDFWKVLGHEVFSTECSLNQPIATRVCIRSINQSNLSISVRLLFLFCSRVFISRSLENRSICLCPMVEMWCLSLIN